MLHVFRFVRERAAHTHNEVCAQRVLPRQTKRGRVRLFLMATWKSGLGNDIYYIHRSVKPVKWPVADGGEEKVVFLREFF